MSCMLVATQTHCFADVILACVKEEKGFNPCQPMHACVSGLCLAVSKVLSSLNLKRGFSSLALHCILPHLLSPLNSLTFTFDSIHPFHVTCVETIISAD